MQRNKEQLEVDGFALIASVLDSTAVAQLISHVSSVGVGPSISLRAGKAFGIRDLLNRVPAARVLAESTLIRSLVALGLENNFRVVRAVYLDKHKDANWKVAWHQDLTIAVRERKEVDVYGPWSLKAGIPHVQPPVSVLERMLAVRIHLDDADETNGVLRVIPGSHLQGRLSAVEVQRLTKETAPVTCPMKRGDVMLLRPLLLHASSVASDPAHRRVLHFEYATGELNGGLQWYEMSDAPTN